MMIKYYQKDTRRVKKREVQQNKQRMCFHKQCQTIAKIYFQEKLKNSVNWLDWEYTEYHPF